MARDIRVATWLFLTSLLFIFVGGLLGNAFIAMPMHISATELAEHYRNNSIGILWFCVCQGIGALVWGLYIPVMIIAMLAMQPRSLYLILTYAMTGMIAVLAPFTSIIFFGAIALRPDISPGLAQVIHDIGKAFLVTSLPTVINGIVLAIAILRDRKDDPILPRWFAWVNIVYAVGTQVNVVAPFFSHGPMALDGAVGLYLPIILVALYIPITAYVILRVRKDRWNDAMPLRPQHL